MVDRRSYNFTFSETHSQFIFIQIQNTSCLHHAMAYPACTKLSNRCSLGAVQIGQSTRPIGLSRSLLVKRCVVNLEISCMGYVLRSFC